MTRFALAAVFALTPLAAPAATLALIGGEMTSFTAPAGFDDSFGLGAPLLGGELTYDAGATFCPDVCDVTAVFLTIGGATVLDQDPVVDSLTLDTTLAGFSLDGIANLGNAFGLTDVVLSFGTFAGAPNTWVMDADEGIAFASGTFSATLPPAPVIPLPATALLLLGGLGAAGALSLRARKKASAKTI